MAEAERAGGGAVHHAVIDHVLVDESPQDVTRGSFDGVDYGGIVKFVDKVLVVDQPVEAGEGGGTAVGEAGAGNVEEIAEGDTGQTGRRADDLES